jgi:hypothetical protein
VAHRLQRFTVGRERAASASIRSGSHWWW